MSFHAAVTRRLGAAVALLAVASCHGPTAPSQEDRSSSAPAIGSRTDDVFDLAGTASSESTEEFNCRDVEEIHFRFSAPGYVRGSRVGLYARYAGVSAGAKLLRIWWDYENEATIFQDVSLGEGEARRDASDLFDIEHLAEHAYPPVNGPVERLVRAELILQGKTGNCARNRWITLNVEPPPEAMPASAQDRCDGLRFCKLADGTVRDSMTGLIWLQDADCLGSRRFPIASGTAAALAGGQCGLSDGSVPGDWRLPTFSELESLLDPRFLDPSLANARGDAQWGQGDAFVDVAEGFYWSTDPVDDCLLGLPGLRVLNFVDGDARCRLRGVGFARFWPVRGP